MFGSKPTVQICVRSLKHCKNYARMIIDLPNSQTFLLLDQRTCQRLARQRSLGRDGARTVFGSGPQCWFPCQGRRGDTHLEDSPVYLGTIVFLANCQVHMFTLEHKIFLAHTTDRKFIYGNLLTTLCQKRLVFHAEFLH